MKKTKISKYITNILFALILLCIIPLAIPKLMGYETFYILTESMEPVLPVGTLVCIDEVAEKDIKKGDIITFYGKGASIVTHRVLEMNNKEYITKGDANKDIDMAHVIYTQILGKVVYSIPFLGYLSAFFNNFYGKLFIIMSLSAIMVMVVLSNRQKKK